MSVEQTHEARAERRDWRGIVFRVVAVLVILPNLTNFPYLLHPWVLWGVDPDLQDPELHRWFDAWQGIGSLFAVGPLLALLWRPRQKPFLMQYLVLLTVLDLLLGAPFIPVIVIVIAVTQGLVIAAYPAPRSLLDFSREGPLSRPLLALSVVAGLLMAPSAWHALMSQVQGVGGELATNFDWVDPFAFPVILVLTGVLASTKRPGWRVLSVVNGIIFLYLGVAALAVPNYPGSWGVIGGILALLGGAGYIVATLLEPRGTAQTTTAAG